MECLRIAGIQTSLTWENAELNRQHFTRQIESIDQEIDIIVLPEMFSTGFSMTPEPLAETMDGPTVQWMIEMASKSEAVITGSLIIHVDHQYVNRMLWITPDGAIDYYDKRHLFTLAGEHKEYTAGNDIKVVDYKGWKFLLNVCYDLRFPVWSRNTGQYDCAIYVANWPKPRVTAWSTLLRARAIENQCYVIGVNRIGIDGNQLPYTGQSAVVDMEGNYLTKAEDEDVIMYSELNRAKLNDFRKRYPFYLDADEFSLKI